MATVNALTPLEWGVEHRPAAATQATASKAASPGVIHVAKSITVCAVGGAAAGTGVIVFVLRDSTTGAGNVLWSATLQALTLSAQGLTIPVNIQGVRGQAMTLESTGAPAATTQVSVALTGYSDNAI